MFNPHSQAIQELLKHLDKSDDDELGAAMKPKGVEVMSIEAKPDGGDNSPGIPGDDAPVGDGTTESGDGSKLSDEEIAELIEALQSKLG